VTEPSVQLNLESGTIFRQLYDKFGCLKSVGTLQKSFVFGRWDQSAPRTHPSLPPFPLNCSLEILLLNFFPYIFIISGEEPP